MQKQNQMIIDLLGHESKQIDKARDVPSQLFRKILYDLRFGMKRWNECMNTYLRDPHNRITQNSRDMSSARGNLAKELVRDRMTWNVFMKALRFLNPLKVKLRLEIEWRTHTVSTYEVDIYRGTDMKAPLHSKVVPDYSVVESPVLDQSSDILRQNLDDIENS